MFALYHPLKGRALWCALILLIHGLVTVVTIAFTFVELDLLSRIERGENVPYHELISSDDRMLVIGWVYIASIVIAGAAFIFWMHRAYRNLEPLMGRFQEHSPWWVIFGWIIPIISLFRPYQLMKEIYRDSSPGLPYRGDTTPLLPFWWALWLVGGWIGTFAGNLMFRGETARDLIMADRFYVVTDALALAALVFALVLVHRITSNQQTKYEGNIAAASSA
ncbi:MAG: DUF4328 domain-containing protein [Dehalococcoidia bacterium]|nr:DUF4328 domain-containing protein [Dehalococcoidia bacterium]